MDITEPIVDIKYSTLINTIWRKPQRETKSDLGPNYLQRLSADDKLAASKETVVDCGKTKKLL